MSSQHQCLSEETVLALVSGGFDEARVCALLAEAERCEDCSLLLHEAGRAVDVDGTDGSDTLPWLNGAGVLRVGSIVASRFRVLRLLGRGGMGEVYEALDNELGELVALKTIRAIHATLRSSVERFRQEVRLARRAVHPNVCRVLEFGRHQVEGAVPVYFLTMELLRGDLLSRHLRRRGRSSALESVAIARQICAGLCAIHEQGILHRDIKSSNIMLCSGPAGPQSTSAQRAVLLDFGIARSLAFEATALSQGALIGTPDYMAPEQLQAQALSPATDVYALGMVLFELLTGELPFAEDPTLTRALKRLQGSPPIPNTEATQLPPKLTRLVAHCLAVSPSDRPQTAAALLDELAAIEQELSGSCVPSRSERAEAKLQNTVFTRARWLAALAIAGGILLLIALGSRTTRPIAAVVSARPSHPPAGPASPPASAHANQSLPSPREATVVIPTPRTGVAAPIARVATPARTAASARVARPPTPVAPSCSPPYYFDGDGFRVYRKECL
ncbi:MAG TPA: serine/threonine-protein kinase [Polyangiaceae bacterium]|nr:serine/threonine-protein kinase [Polyangiaceae bacterium]